MINTICTVEERVADGEHKHQCHKCGTCFKHEDRFKTASLEEFDEGHTCPHCGETNITKKVQDDQMREKQDAAIERYLGRKPANQEERERDMKLILAVFDMFGI